MDAGRKCKQSWVTLSDTNSGANSPQQQSAVPAPRPRCCSAAGPAACSSAEALPRHTCTAAGAYRPAAGQEQPATQPAEVKAALQQCRQTPTSASALQLSAAAHSQCFPGTSSSHGGCTGTAGPGKILSGGLTRDTSGLAVLAASGDMTAAKYSCTRGQMSTIRSRLRNAMAISSSRQTCSSLQQLHVPPDTVRASNGCSSGFSNVSVTAPGWQSMHLHCYRPIGHLLFHITALPVWPCAA